MKAEFSRPIVEKSSCIRFHKNPSTGGRSVHAERQTGVTKLIVAFRYFANASKMQNCPYMPGLQVQVPSVLALSLVGREWSEPCCRRSKHVQRWENLIRPLLRCYAAWSDNFLPTFRDNLSFPCWRLKKFISWPLKIGPVGCPETSVRNYHCLLRNSLEERMSHTHRDGSLKSRMTKSPAEFELCCVMC